MLRATVRWPDGYQNELHDDDGSLAGQFCCDFTYKGRIHKFLIIILTIILTIPYDNIDNPKPQFRHYLINEFHDDDGSLAE